MENKPLNRIKAVLAERQVTSKKLAEELEMSESTISKWCQNKAQPDLHTINRVANILGVDPRELITGNE